jgi:hypothetical protein
LIQLWSKANIASNKPNGDQVMNNDSLEYKRHEVRVQELRQERKREVQHLQDIKTDLQTKLRATAAGEQEEAQSA